jgi:hypothetical protein
MRIYFYLYNFALLNFNKFYTNFENSLVQYNNCANEQNFLAIILT